MPAPSKPPLLRLANHHPEETFSSAGEPCGSYPSHPAPTGSMAVVASTSSGMPRAFLNA